MNFKPIGKWLSVRFRPPSTKTKGGLYLPRPIYSQIATIISVGGQVEQLKAGDTVMMHKYGDAMTTQESLWHHYFAHIAAKPEDKDFEVAPVVVTEDDVFGYWDDEKGLIPHRSNVVFVEYEVPEKVNGIYIMTRHRQNRKPIGEIVKMSSKVTGFKKKQVVLLGKYGGVYFTDVDGKEKVLVSTKEILGTMINANRKTKVLVGEPNEMHDPKAGTEFLNQ